MVAISQVKELQDGRLVFTGQAADGGPVVCRSDANGRLDALFGVDGCASARTIGEGKTLEIDDEGRIVLAGVLTYPSGHFVARFTSNGVVDATFGALGEGVLEVESDSLVGVYSIAIDSQTGTIVVSGLAGRTGPSATMSGFLSAVTREGEADLGFGVDGKVTFGSSPAEDVLLHYSTRLFAASGNEIYGFDAHGNVDPEFGTNGVVSLPFRVHAIAQGLEGDILAVGRGMSVARVSIDGAVTSVSPVIDAGVTREGSPRTAYGYDIQALQDGRIVIGGITGDDVGPAFAIAVLTPAGTVETPFLASAIPLYANGVAFDLEVLSDGRYLLAGTEEFNSGKFIRVWN